MQPSNWTPYYPHPKDGLGDWEYHRTWAQAQSLPNSHIQSFPLEPPVHDQTK